MKQNNLKNKENKPFLPKCKFYIIKFPLSDSDVFIDSPFQRLYMFFTINLILKKKHQLRFLQPRLCHPSEKGSQKIEAKSRDIEKIGNLDGAVPHVVFVNAQPVETVQLMLLWRLGSWAIVMLTENRRDWKNTGLLLGQRLRRWPNIKPTLFKCV